MNAHEPPSSRRNPSRRGKGEGSVFQRKDGRWVAQVTLEDGSQKQFYAKTQKAAQTQRRLALRQQEEGTLPSGPDQPLSSFLDHWLETIAKPTLKLSSYTRYRDVLHTHILPALGHLTLGRLRVEHLERFYAQKMEPGEHALSARSIHLIHGILHQALAVAVKRRYLSRNVCDDVKLPRVPKPEVHALSKEEAQRLLTALHGHRLEPLFALALTTGMRRGELLALTWEDINWQAGSIAVRRTVNRYGADHGYVVSEPKTGKARRVMIPPFVMRLLEQQQANISRQRASMGTAWQERNLIFSNATGFFLDPNLLGREFEKLLRQAKLPAMRFHDLRHSAATILLSMGVHAKVVQEILGHSTITMTLDTYSHVLPSLHQEAMQQLDAYFGSASAQQANPPKPGEGGESEP